MIRTALPALVLAAGLVAPAAASSSDAWSEHEDAVTAACVAASGLNEAKAASDLILYDDSIGIDALVIAGGYPQAHMAGQVATMLCLYNKAEGTAAVSEITMK